MKAVTAQLKAHLALPKTTIAKLWKVTRTDGRVFGFTEHDRTITYGGIHYQMQSAFTGQAIQTMAGLNVDNLEVQGVFDSQSITEADVRAGLWDFARIELFEVNWSDLSMEAINQRVGWIGDVRTANIFFAELRGLMQRLAESIGRSDLPSCDADLGDARCTINLATFARGRVSGSVVTVTSQRQFADPTNLTDADDWFTFGLVKWTSGLNAGISMEVKDFGSGVVVLEQSMPYVIQVGDGFSIDAGCDKIHTTCNGKYSNIINFRGRPHIRGIGKLLEAP